jgi:hypothetical protein
MSNKMGLTLAVLAAITLAGCGEVSSSVSSSSSASSSSASSSSSVAVDGTIAKLDAAALTLDGLIADPSNITVGFQVPAQLANQITAVWTSDEPGVLSFATQAVSGFLNVTVNRPAKGDGDATFDISAVLSRQSELTTDILTKTWTKEVTVKENTVEEVVIDNVEDILALTDPALDRALNVTLNDMTVFARSAGEAFAFDGTGTIQIYGGAASNLTVGKVYTISGLIDWYFGIWEIVNSTATEQVGATPAYPSKEVISSVQTKITALTTAGEHLAAPLNATAGNFEPIYASVTGKVYKIPGDTGNYNTWLMDTESTGYVAGTAGSPSNSLMVYYQTNDYALLQQYDGIVITIDVVIYTYRSNNQAFAIYYVGGQNGVVATLSDEQKQTIDTAALSVPTSITEATTLTLPTTGVNGSTIAWVSNNPAIINADTGVVTIPNPAVVVTLTASVVAGQLTAVTRTFDVVVGELQNTTMTTLLTKTVGSIAYSEVEIVWLAANKRSAVVADSTGYGFIFNSVALDITLGQFIGANYTVAAFNGLIQMSAVKLLTPKGTDPNITPTAQVWTATEANALTTATVWAPTLVTMELVGYANGNFTNGYLAGFGTKFVQTNNAPVDLRGKKFTMTAWTTGRGAGNPAPSITLGSLLAADFTSIVAAATDPTDAEKLSLSVERFVAPAANSEVTGNLTLPTTATFATVAWTSSNEAVITNVGVVTRPASGQPDASVTLSYVLTVGAESTQPVTIAYTVKAQEATPPTLPTDIFISEYIEGSSYNKAIEIFNGTGASVDLSQYSVQLFPNGASAAYATLALSGTLANNDVYVIAHNSAAQVVQVVADFLADGAGFNGVVNYNGNDALALIKGSTQIDVFGVIGTNPGTNWVVGTGFTSEFTLVRKGAVRSGVTTWDASQWDVYAQDTYTYLGSHSLA